MATVNGRAHNSGQISEAFVEKGALWVDRRSPLERAKDLGLAFAATIWDNTNFTVTPAGAVDSFFYLENIAGSGRKLHVSSIYLRGASAENVIVGAGAAVNNSSQSPTAAQVLGLNVGGSLSVTGVVKAEYDPDLSAIAVTTPIGQLSAGVVGVWTPFKVTLNPGQAMWLTAVAGSIALAVSVHFWLD